MRPQVGILGIGTYLPPQVRTNDWWPAATVRRWTEMKARPAGETAAPVFDSEGQRLAAEAMAALSADPFRGSVERRVIPEGMQSSDMEVAAARDALARAKMEPRDVDLLLVSALCPDYLMPTNAGVVHRHLGLPERCLALGAEAACNSFLAQLALAEGMIAGGRHRCALLIQSSSISRLLSPEEPYSAWFGDGATAVVVGPVGEGRGLLGRSHHTSGENHRAVVIGVPDRRWYEAGESRFYQDDSRHAVRMMKAIVDRAREAIGEATAEAGMVPEEIDFYACHQGLAWLRQVTQAYGGLARARAVDTFSRFGSLGAGNLPLILSIAERERMLEDGDSVAMFAGGAGEVWSSLVLRWGRG